MIPANIFRGERKYSLNIFFEFFEFHLVVIVEVALVVVDDDGDGPGPGALDPLDVAGSQVGGVVVARRQHRVQGGGDPLTQNTWDIDTSSASSQNLYQSLESSAPIIGLLLSSSLAWCGGWQTMNVAESSKWIIYKLFISGNRFGNYFYLLS